MNPYEAPRAPLQASPHGQQPPAERMERFAAALLDNIIALVVLMPLMYFGGYFDRMGEAIRAQQDMPLLYVAMWQAIGFVVFIAVQGVPLTRNGQTWGKRAAGIRIVDMDGNVPPVGRLLGLRYAPPNFIALVPVIGMLAVLVDILMVFRADRRCGHDLIAGTRVVRAS